MTDNTKDALRMALGWSNDSEWKAQALAEFFHSTYERLAPQFGYETRTETRRFDPESANGKLMIVVCAEVLVALTSPDPKEAAQDERELDLYDEIECDLPHLFGRASAEGHEAGQRLAKELQEKMRQARAALSAQSVRGQALEEAVKDAEHRLQEMSDSEYCEYVRQLQHQECLGAEAKILSGKFGLSELRAHIKAYEHRGSHRGIMKALNVIRALSSQPAQKEAGNG